MVGVWNFHGLTVDGEALGEAGALDLLAAAVNAGATSAMRWGTLQETAGYVREGLLVAGALHGTGPRHPGGPGVLIGDEGAHTGGRQVLVVEAVTGATAQLAAGAGAMTAEPRCGRWCPICVLVVMCCSCGTAHGTMLSDLCMLGWARG